MIDRFLGGELRNPAALIVGFASQTSALLDPDIAKLGDAMDDCEVSVDTASILATRRRVTAIRSQAISYRRNMTVLDVMIAVGGLTDYAAGNRASGSPHNGRYRD